ncbi:hypothetical protein ABE088_29085 [Priestia megaterium]
MFKIKSFKDLIGTIDLAFILTAITIMGYALCYCYSLGQNDYYRLPFSFVELDIKGLAATAIKFPFAVILLFIASPYLRRIKEEEEKKRYEEEKNSREKKRLNKKKKKQIIYIYSAFGLVFLCICIVSVKWDSIDLIKIISRTLFLIVIGLFLFLTLVPKKIRPFIISLTLISSLGYAYFLGVSEAQELERHYIITTEKIESTEKTQKLKKNEEAQTYILIKVYKDQLIVAPVNFKKKIIIPSYQIIDIKSNKDDKTKLEQVDTGKLKIDEINKSDIK